MEPHHLLSENHQELTADQQTCQESYHEQFWAMQIIPRGTFSPHSYLAMAIKCNTALVDPPNAMTTTIAFRSDFIVIISRGFKSIFIKSRRYFPAKWHSCNFNGSSAGVEELLQIKNNKKVKSKKWHQKLWSKWK